MALVVPKIVDAFCQKLSSQLQILSENERNQLIMQIDQRESVMRSTGQERPIWLGPKSEIDILGESVVLPTMYGERCGKVICFGVIPSPENNVHERSVIVYVESSGTCIEAPGSLAKMADANDLIKSSQELSIANRLKITAATMDLDSLNDEREKQEDPRILALLDVASRSENVSKIEHPKIGHKIIGKSGRKIYILPNAKRVDLSGFTIEHASVRQISVEQAKSMHLGNVRGQMSIDAQDIMSAFECALSFL